MWYPTTAVWVCDPCIFKDTNCCIPVFDTCEFLNWLTTLITKVMFGWVTQISSIFQVIFYSIWIQTWLSLICISLTSGSIKVSTSLAFHNVVSSRMSRTHFLMENNRIWTPLLNIIHSQWLFIHTGQKLLSEAYTRYDAIILRE